MSRWGQRSDMTSFGILGPAEKAAAAAAAKDAPQGGAQIRRRSWLAVASSHDRWRHPLAPASSRRSSAARRILTKCSWSN